MNGKQLAQSPKSKVQSPKSKVQSLKSKAEDQRPESGEKSKIQNPKSKIERGFSLLELMIAMFIIIILLAVALPVYRISVQHAKETVLAENLWQMRRAIDQYQADKGKYPETLDKLVEDGYLREKPVDPITEEKEWATEPAENVGTDGQGIKNVKSVADGTDSDGKEYKDY